MDLVINKLITKTVLAKGSGNPGVLTSFLVVIITDELTKLSPQVTRMEGSERIPAHSMAFWQGTLRRGDATTLYCRNKSKPLDKYFMTVHVMRMFSVCLVHLIEPFSVRT